MTVCAIICELNPFHYGHELIFQRAKKLTKADYVIAIMSGDFVQRGLPAVCDKYARAKMALYGGADLVIELPALYSTASADYFAFGAVLALDNLRCVDYLCFGSECGEVEFLRKYVKNNVSYDNEVHILSQGNNIEKPIYRKEIADFLREGNSYSKAAAMVSGYELSSNDMLAACYIKSIMYLKSKIQPITVKRQGSDYLDDSQESDSASAIRKRIKNGKDIRELVPSYVIKCLNEIEYEGYPVDIDDFSIQLYTRIDTVLREESRGNGNLTDYMDVSNNIAGRIRSNFNDFTSYRQFISEVHSKEYTKSRVMRALLHILLDIRKTDYADVLRKCEVPYIRILGFKRQSGELLSAIKENSIIPVISKAGDARKILDDDALKMYMSDIHAANMYEQACAFKFSNNPIHDFSKEIIIM